MARRLEDVERRLTVKDTALNEVTKEIRELKNNQNKSTQSKSRTLRNSIDPEIFDYLFNYCYEENTGHPCKADTYRINHNFTNLYSNVMMTCGYTYANYNSASKKYYAKSLAIKDIPESEYQDFCELLRKITELIYSFKSRREAKGENNEEI